MESLDGTFHGMSSTKDVAAVLSCCVGIVLEG